MGQLDFKQKSACTSSVHRKESCILHANNKTEHWLREKDSKRTGSYFKQWQVRNRDGCQKNLHCKKTNEDYRRRKNKEKSEKIKQLRNKKRQRYDKSWHMGERERAQDQGGDGEINIRKGEIRESKIINQQVFELENNYNELLQFSSKGNMFDTIKLQENLTKLITLKSTETQILTKRVTGKINYTHVDS